jgi:hypothetical protein
LTVPLTLPFDSLELEEAEPDAAEPDTAEIDAAWSDWAVPVGVSVGSNIDRQTGASSLQIARAMRGVESCMQSMW